MRLLLDTHTFLWWIEDAPDLSKKARQTIGNVRNECLFSLASCWELAIKVSLGKLSLASPIEKLVPDQLAANQFRLLDIGFRHVSRVAQLPFHHRDPFDRLLAAQALDERLAVVTADSSFEKYGVKRIW
jgi:PIN domain nuclease of toxin-antitoxin system